MKSNKNKKMSKGLEIRPELSGTETTTAEQAAPQPAPAQDELIPAPTPQKTLPYVNYQQRDKNRALTTGQVLEILREQVPTVLPLAEIVGQWIWVTFAEIPEAQVRGQLSQIGFHWNNARKCWQHPCGQFAAEGSGQDPRTKYGTRAAA